MKILYIYPHPDDESFGPAPVMSQQRRQGHDVYLLTLTKGGATKQRFKYNYSIEKMGNVRFKEMQNVAKVLDLTGMTVLDLPDSGLKEMDPQEIEKIISAEIARLSPQVVVTYAVHGISGFHDHLVSHAVVKRVFCESRKFNPALKRLAFHTLTEAQAQKSSHFHLNGSKEEEIDCIVEVEAEDIKRGGQALDCYVTFRETIEKTRIREFISQPIVFEFFQEDFSPPLTDLFASLP
jgi:LmbE family N-acetylglucosaminyl deacetylase